MKKAVLIITMLFLIILTGCVSGDSTEVKNGFYSNVKGDVFCIINNGRITLSQRTDANSVTASAVVSYTFDFTLNDGLYSGENAGNKISFRASGDRLNLKLNGKTYYLSLDSSVTVKNEAIKLNKPSNINFDLSQISWRTDDLSNPYESGILNACLEIIRLESDKVKTEYVDYIPEPASMFLFDLKNMELEAGDYILSIRYIGGFYFKNGAVYNSADSEAVVFYLTVTEDDGYIVTPQKENS